MTALLAWIWAPLALYLVLLGLGLLADRVLAADVPGALLAPLGLGLGIVLVTPLFRLGASATVVTPLLAAAAVAGLLLARGELRERAWQPGPLAAGVGVYLLYTAPILASGEATWAGYNFVNDTAQNFILIDLLEAQGATARGDVSAFSEVANYLATSGYPIGSHALVAAWRPLTGASVEALYQPAMSMLAALTAMSLTEIARRAGLRPLSAAAAATLAMGGVLTYRYALHGAIKELAQLALGATTAALAAVALERRLPTRMVVLIAVCCLAMVFAFSAAAGAYAVALGIVVVAVVALSPGRADWRHLGRLAGVATAIAVVVLLPSLGSTLDFTRLVTDIFSPAGADSTTRLGQLLRPLPVAEAAGVWLGPDYRTPVESDQKDLNALLIAGSITMAAAGLVICVRRRRHAPLVLLGVLALPAAALFPLVTPYIEAKLLAILTPAVVLLGSLACFTLIQGRRRGLRLAGGAALLVLAAGVVASDVYTYRATRLAPLDRVASMEDVGDHVPRDGLWLLNEWEEFGKYFMRSARINPAGEPQTPSQVQLRRLTSPFGRWWDLDLQKLAYVQSFPGLIMRRSPTASRPPVNFRMIYRNRYYEVWRRSPDVRVRRHLALQASHRATAVPACPAVVRMARNARPGERLVAARPANVSTMIPTREDRPAAWQPSPASPGIVVPIGPGSVRGTVVTGAGARVRVWLHATGGRPYTVWIDGRRVGKVGQVNTPEQWLEVGTLALASGRHQVEIRRGGVSPAPGNGFRGELGPLALQSIEAPELISVAPRNARRLCGRSWDWIELARG